MSMGVGCNILYMSLLRVYVYQVNRNIWVCVRVSCCLWCCLWGVMVVWWLDGGELFFKLQMVLFCVNGGNLVFFAFVQIKLVVCCCRNCM